MAATGSTNNWAAAAQTNDAAISYCMETEYGVAPTGDYQSTRFTGENFRKQKTRQRPDEINGLAEASQAVTTQSALSGTLSGALSSDTYDDFLSAVMRADWADGVLKNGTSVMLVKTFTIREKMLSGYFHRTGCFPTQAQFSFQQGQFATCSFDFTGADEVKSTADIAKSLLAAPSGTVMDTIGGFGGVTLGGVAPVGKIRQFSVTLGSTDSKAEYVMGSEQAEGIVPGEFIASGQIQIMFKTFDEYDKFSENWQGVIEATVTDGSGNGYKFTFLNASLQNPQINAGSKNTSVVATFDIEGNPQDGGGTFQITKVAPAAPASTGSTTSTDSTTGTTSTSSTTGTTGTGS